MGNSRKEGGAARTVRQIPPRSTCSPASANPSPCGTASGYWSRDAHKKDHPRWRPAGAVARPEPLRHDAFEAHLAGVPEYALAVVGEVLVQTQTRKAPTSS